MDKQLSKLKNKIIKEALIESDCMGSFVHIEFEDGTRLYVAPIENSTLVLDCWTDKIRIYNEKVLGA